MARLTISRLLVTTLLWAALATAALAADPTLPFTEWRKTKPPLKDSNGAAAVACKVFEEDSLDDFAEVERRIVRPMTRLLPGVDLDTALATPACAVEDRQTAEIFMAPPFHIVAGNPTDLLPMLKTMEAYYAEKLGRPEVFRALLSLKDERGFTALDTMEKRLRGERMLPQELEPIRHYIAMLCDAEVAYTKFANRCDPGDYPAAIAAYDQRARQGDAAAMLRLAEMNRYGLGMTKSPAKAIGYYKQAAAAGNAEALALLDSAYRGGVDGQGQDWAAAAQMARDRGAYLSVAHLYETGGPNLPQDKGLALAWSKKAYETAKTKWEREAAALEVMRRSIAAGDWSGARQYAELGRAAVGPGSEAYAEMIIQLANMDADGRAGPRNEDRFIALHYEFSACSCIRRGPVRNKFTDADDVQLIRRFAERGDRRAAYLMGEEYVWGRLGQKDYAGAAPWYLAAARAGEPFAQDQIGQMYLVGFGVPEDAKTAYAWKVKAANQGHTGAIYDVKTWKYDR